MKDSFYKFPIDFVPSMKARPNNSYDNKPLLKWDADDFASYIFDNSDIAGNFTSENTFINDYPEMLRMISCAPSQYKRVYYYGVFDCFKDLHIGKKKMV